MRLKKRNEFFLSLSLVLSPFFLFDIINSSIVVFYI